jgi:UDP-N-acetylmuramoyl-L-alanyl-D-glutamate--2,6-diaminopimelate ligase
MILQDLLDAVDIDTEVRGERSISVRGLAADSRRVQAGDVFFAVRGERDDGCRYVPDAITRGAVVVVSTARDPAWGDTPTVVTGDVRRCLGRMAARFWGDPTERLTAVAVTGTNGKTSLTYLVEGLWRTQGTSAGVIGTVSYRSNGRSRPAPLTTPEAIDLQGELAAMVADGVEGVAVEVSSHALAMERTRGCHWDVAVFTNLSHDHLDFHQDLESYYGVKARLFLDHLPASMKPSPVAVVNVDDAFGARLAHDVSVRLVTFGRSTAATVHPLHMEASLTGLQGELSVGGVRVAIDSPLIGEQHVYNILAAAGVAHGLGMPSEVIETGIRTCTPAPGRLERVGREADRAVFVDYAHTPHALEGAIAALRPLAAGRIVTVFGCGGDRDRSKRPMMGEIAGRTSHVVVLTSDNPRTEDPGTILREIETGVVRSGLQPEPLAALCAGAPGYATEPDRRAAIELALRIAGPDDIVLVAGKGHEDYQIVGTERRAFDDRAEVRRVLGVAP